MSAELDHDALPAAVRGFVDGWQSGNEDEVAALFTTNAIVTDEGRTHRGETEIRAWIQQTIHLFSTTLTYLGGREVDGMVGASYRLEGDFPGGVVDLEYQFHLDDDGKIVQLDFAEAAA